MQLFYFLICMRRLLVGILYSIQSVVGSQLLLVMAPLGHITTQLRELRYSSDVTQHLSQLGGWGQCVERMEGGTLSLPLLCAQVRHRIDYNYKSTLDNANEWSRKLTLPYFCDSRRLWVPFSVSITLLIPSRQPFNLLVSQQSYFTRL